MTEALEHLRQVFGYDAFRAGQEEVISAVSEGSDVLAIMPTGGGKSLLFQLPALMRPGVTVVISPLIALMRDQVRALRAAGVEAGALTSQNDAAENTRVLDALKSGALKLLYLAPERLGSAGAMQLLRDLQVGLLAVDEAHCVSQWGHDFRPDYLRIGALRQTLGSVQTIALTATADAETREEIVQRLFGDAPPKVFLHGFDRPNIDLVFSPKNRPRQQVQDFVGARRGLSGIVYCATRSKTETLAKSLRQEGHSALAYHAGLESAERASVEQRFQTEDGLIVCATVAFGMGIDKPDIRYVAHADLPKSIEAYYQEIGRAGRDGAPAETLTLYGSDDIRLRRSQIDESATPAERKSVEHARLNALLGLAEAKACRRQVLLGYFGEERDADCGACDLCRDKPVLFDATEAAQKAFSAILRTGETFGAEHLISVLRGDPNDRIISRGHDQLPTFGVGQEFSAVQWRMIFRQLMGHDLVRPDPTRHGALRLTETARPLLRGEATLELRQDSLKRAAEGVSRPVRAAVGAEDAGLLSALKAKRRTLAQAKGVPAYVIFPDRTLIEIATNRPATLDEMRAISGVGAVKLKRFGAAFLEVVLGEAPAPVHPARRRLVGGAPADLYDRLEAVQQGLALGDNGLEKRLSCDAPTLARIARARPANLESLSAIQGMDPRLVARFGDAFLDAVLDDESAR